MRLTLTVVLGVGLSLLACTTSQPTVTSEEDIAAINQARALEAEGASSGDANAALAAYAEDVVFMPPNEPAMTGHDAVRAWFQAASEQMDISVTYTASDVAIAGDWAIERYAGTATFTPKGGGDSVREQIKGIHIYRRQADGTWKIAQDVWNSDAPPPAM